MKTILMGLLLAVSAVTFAQNGGQAPENSSVRVRYAGNLHTWIVNKQTCNATIKITYNKKSFDTLVSGNDSVLISTPTPDRLTAKTTTNCGSADFGLVELNITVQVLPIKFEWVKYKWTDGHTLQVTFKVAEVSGTNVIKIRAGVDPNPANWTDKYVRFGADTQAGGVYEANLIY